MCNDIELPLSFSHYFILSCMTLLFFSHVSTKNMVFVPLIIAFQCILLVHKVSDLFKKYRTKKVMKRTQTKLTKWIKKAAPSASKNWARR